MVNEKYLVRKSATNKFYDVKDATDILAQWGISHNEKKTRDLIAKGKLKARTKGEDPNDRRSGYEVSEKSIYDLVITEIPIMKEVFEMLNPTKPTKNKKNAPKESVGQAASEMK